MKHPRHGHSVCQIKQRYIIVSGTRKDCLSLFKSSFRVECYDSQIDEWKELPMMNEGRHYHSSCNLNHKFVFVFGGIRNREKRYSNTIERLKFEDGQW